MMRRFQFRKQSYQINVSKRFFSLCFVFFILFCLLGTWQLYRYHYKKNLLSAYAKRLNDIPKPFMLLSGELNDLQFQSVAVDGKYMNELTLLIQNRIHKGEVGFDVLTPLAIAGEKKLLLVDRGWVKKPLEHLLLPILSPQHITGYIKLLNEYQFILGKNILNPTEKPLVMQKIDLTELERVTRQEYYPFVMRLDPSESHGFIRDWVISSVIPAKHMMYAVQWFAMAVVLVIATLSFSIERVRGRSC